MARLVILQTHQVSQREKPLNVIKLVVFKDKEPLSHFHDGGG